MTRSTTLILTLLCCTLAAGCMGRVPFTSGLKTRYQLNPDQVKDLQFFISHGVMLERRVGSEGHAVSKNHKLVVRSGQKVEQVAILPGTPGVVVESGEDYIDASFEEGTHLRFKVNPALGGKYTLECAPQGPGGKVNLYTSEGAVEFKSTADGHLAHLQIDKARMDQYEHKTSIQKGRTLE